MTRRTFLVLALGLSMAGCQSSHEQRPSIRFGRDVCAQCRMIISEARFAAAYITKHGQWHFFDDIGCMLEFYKAHKEDVAVFWVHDYETGDWLKPEGAFFVKSPALHTPMGHGIVAVGSRERAEQLAQRFQGTLFTDLFDAH